jgi:flagellar protein FliL
VVTEVAKAEAKNQTENTEAAKAEAADEAAASDAPRKRFGKKFLLVAGGGALLLIVALAAGIWFLFFRSSDSSAQTSPEAQAIPLVPPQVAYYDMPDLVVNIQSADGSPAYLKLSVSLELATMTEKSGIQVLMPRIVDQFQGYLRELRVDDLRGSAGIMRLKEELLRRINVAAAPYPVRDVLLKEMIVQ